jgi:hypothetical protein
VVKGHQVKRDPFLNQAEDLLHGDTGASHTRLPEMHLRIDDDSFPIILCALHLLLLTSQDDGDVEPDPPSRITAYPGFTNGPAKVM